MACHGARERRGMRPYSLSSSRVLHFACMAGNEQSGGFTPGELQMASWWVKNRLMLRKLGYGSLIAVCAAFWGYVLWGFLDAYAISYPRESRITRDIAVNLQLLSSLESDRPQNLGLSDVGVFANTDNRFDMEVAVTNPNAQWWAEFNYRFNLSGEDTPLRSGYVLPGGEQHATEVGFKPTTRGGRSATFEIVNLRWHRVDPSMVGSSYPDFATQRQALEFRDLTYDTDLTVGNRKVGQTSFTLVNNGAFGYWNLELFVRLYRGSLPVAISSLTVANLSPGEKRPMQIVWLDNPSSVSKTEIIPQVNLLDPAAYLPTQYFK